MNSEFAPQGKSPMQGQNRGLYRAPRAPQGIILKWHVTQYDDRDTVDREYAQAK